MANPTQITGGDAIARALAEFPVKIEVLMMRGGLRTGALLIAADAKARVPVQSGALRDSIKVRTGKKRDGKVFAYVVAGSRKNKDSPWYAHLVEYGVKPHIIVAGGGTKSGKALAAAGRILGEKVDHPGANAKPFMRPALSSQASNAIEAMAEYLRARIERGK